ncbi:SpoIIE family protein phosphatase [Isoptericola halotolerans]|uniref:PAS domain S-box-containing protein n=1 Tax=Isoptericola halotolerans TaxID=300560 RepID=A0ABX2A9J0_9MICO|nr:SpoIIE family protein phosphatase [Isoptericola halotolerans]NOV98735.1 PAS domain S-box-containing protein [Isoptericola halotolerans]
MDDRRSATPDTLLDAEGLLPGVADPVEVASGGAVLLLDTATERVVDANPVAVRMARGLGLPVSFASWCTAAGITPATTVATSPAPAILASLRHGHGLALRSTRRGDDSVSWAVGLPLAGAPEHLVDRALLVILPTSGLQESASPSAPPDGLQMRAAVASHLSFTISDPSLPDDPLVWVNPAFTLATGYTADEVVGRNCRFLQGAGTDPAAVGRIRAALEAGDAVGETLLNYRKDGTPFWNQVVVSPVLDEDGLVTHHVGIQTDVTDRVHDDRRQLLELDAVHRQNERLALLANITQALVSLFDEEAGAALLPDLVAPHFGSWCAVVVVDDHNRPRLVHVAARDAARSADVALLERSQRWAFESGAIQRVLGADGPNTLPAPFPVDVESLPRRTSPEELAALERLGLGSAIVVPLRGRDRVIGVLVVVSSDDVDAFPQDDVRDIVALGARSGLALDNARLYRREHDAAVTLQRSMLPEIVEAPGLDCAALYEAASAGADVGGDWYDVVPLPSGQVAVSVGDVVGHDIRAAASMGQLRSVIRSEAWSGRSPAEVVATMDELVQGLGMAGMATCVFALVDPPDDEGSRRVTYTRAGHPPPLLLRADRTVELLDGALTTPVGVSNLDDTVPVAETVLCPGESLVLFTDGLVERRDRSLRAQLADLRTCAGEITPGMDATGVRDAIVEVCADGSTEDDTCILVVRNTPA